MLILVVGLAMTVPQCTDLPRSLSGWERSAEGLDTRHATILAARNGAAETQVTIRKAGTFGIAADQPGWIDVARGKGRPLRIAARAPGLACANIEKIVYYRLESGKNRT